MNLIDWDNSYRTGHHMVDRQHQELFRMVNDLHRSILAGQGRQVLNSTLEKLVNYTVQHFSAEERLMREVGYPSTSDHMAKHIDLATRVSELVGMYKSGEVVLTITLSRFLADWLKNHIKEDDMALIQFVQKRQAPLAVGAQG